MLSNFPFHRTSFKDKQNKIVVETLIREVQGVNPTFQAIHIRGKVCQCTVVRTLTLTQLE